MSWDADLISAVPEHLVGAYPCTGSWNYTHNTNEMIASALYDIGVGDAFTSGSGPLGSAIGPTWWKRLDGCDGATGAKFLTDLIVQLDSEPARYRAMNPPNGWGSYDTLLPVLREMLLASLTEVPSTWLVSG